MVGPNRKAEHKDADHATHEQWVTVDRLPAEDGSQLRGNPECRQGDDVNLRMAHEPEEVLIEPVAAAAGRYIEGSVEHPVCGDVGLGKHECGEGDEPKQNG